MTSHGMEQNKLSEHQIEQIANALSGLSVQQWDEVQRIMEHLYHPIKEALTSAEISASIKKCRTWL